MKTKILLFSFILTTVSFAQEVISTQGESYVTANASIDFTIGEVVINTGTDGTNNLTQGFHQSSWNFLGQYNHGLSFEAIIFPNPTEDIMNIKASKFENISYMLFDSMGKLVLSGKLLGEETPIQVSELAAGCYSVTLNNASQSLKTFKLIKMH